MEQPLDRVIAAIAKSQKIRIHEIDIENLVGNGLVNVYDVRRIHDMYMSTVPVGGSDIVIVAAGPQNKQAVYEGWGNAVYQWRKGKDGADNALADFFFGISSLEKVSHLYLASGDGGLAPVASEAARQGLVTTIVTTNGVRSWKLNVFDSITLTEKGLK